MNQPKQQFGGSWTAEKLERIRKYLVAYATIMNRQNFRYAYIDAFAGTGYRTIIQEEAGSETLFGDLIEPEPIALHQGSARIALEVQPRFTRYIFIEKEAEHFEDLEQLKNEYPELRDDISLINDDANYYLQNICTKGNWNKSRAVLFLDPFGMQVKWDTITAIANTKAIDLWLLFPLGVAVNRLLRRDGMIDQIWRNKLDEMFGEQAWYDAFYKQQTEENLFGSHTVMKKMTSFKTIEDYFVMRLKTIFSGVATNPLPLLNSKNNPLYLLCFAAGNPRGATTAVKIAQDILRR